MNFAGDQVDEAQAAFSKFVSVSHDPKAAQLGEFVYANGTVRPPTSHSRPHDKSQAVIIRYFPVL